jgi:hypothetical protein
MRLIKKELAVKLGVSERALSSWQNDGMPVLEHGRRGQPNSYDFVACVQWIRRTGAGQLGRAGPRIDLCRLEQEAGLTPPAPVQTPALSPQEERFPDPATVRAIEQATGDCLVEAAAWMVHLFHILPATAIHCAEIVAHEQASAFEAAHGFNTGPYDLAGDSLLLLEDLVARVAQRVSELAPGDLGVYEGFFESDA